MATRMLMQDSLFQYALYRSHDVVDGEAEVLEKLRPRGRLAVAVDANHGALEPHVLAPEIADAGFHCDLGKGGDQHHVAVHWGLPVEKGCTGHRDDAHGNPFLRELPLRAQGQLNLRPRSEDDPLGLVRVLE